MLSRKLFEMSSCLMVFFILCGTTFSNASVTTNTISINSINNRIPLFFVENKGQANDSVKYYSFGNQMYFDRSDIYTHLSDMGQFSTKDIQNILFNKSTTLINVKNVVIRKHFINSNNNCEIIGEDELSGGMNYFIGSDTSKWYSNVKTFKQIRYKNIYPGIDLIFHGKNGPSEYDFVINPEAHNEDKNPLNQIKFNVDGADKYEISSSGDLIIHTALGIIKEKSPVSYQYKNGCKESVASKFVLTAGNSVSFSVSEYDKSQPLIIDPLVYSTFLGGGNSDNSCGGIATDTSGCIYVTGMTKSLDFPIVPGSFDETANPFIIFKYDSYVTKLDPTGSSLIYSTYLGGTYDDYPRDITVDEEGNAYVAGVTMSSDYPTTTGAIDRGLGGVANIDCDGYVTKLNSTGSALLYSTYIGGSNYDYACAIAVDKDKNAYVTGITYSSADFPITTNAYDTTMDAGDTNCFITKINSSGTGLFYSTYLGGSSGEQASDIAVDSAGNAYLTGFTSSTDFPVTSGAFDMTFNGNCDCFITKLNTSGTGLVYSSFLGGSSYDGAYPITVLFTTLNANSYIYIDNSCNAYIAGYTSSTDFPITTGVLDTTCNSGDCFITKVDSTGENIVYSTYYGGNSTDFVCGIALDKQNNICLKVYSVSTDYPITDNTDNQNQDQYGSCMITIMNNSCSELLYSTSFAKEDNTKGILVDKDNYIYITGYASSSTFQTTAGAFDRNYNDIYVAKLASILTPAEANIFWGNPLSGYSPLTVQFFDISTVTPISCLWQFGDGSTSTIQNPVHIYTTSGCYTVQLIIINSYGTITEIKPDYVSVSLYDDLKPNVMTLPNLKLLINDKSGINFDLEDYNEKGQGETYSIINNFMGLSSLASSTISQSVYDYATSGINSYMISNQYGISTASNRVKYSTFRLKKLPWLGLSPDEKEVIDLLPYCYSSTGNDIPASFSNSESLIVSDTTLLRAIWKDSTNLEVTALSGFTSAGWIDVIASPLSSNYGIDQDKERIWVYPNLLKIGSFTTFNDIWKYGLEKVPNKSEYPAVNYLVSTCDCSGEYESNVMSFDFTDTNQGIKMTPGFSSMVNYQKTNWYIARMKLCSPTDNNDLISQLYNINGIIPDNPHIDLSANVLFGVPTTWYWLETPLYTNSTNAGYPQIMLIAGNKTGKIFISDVQVINAVPTLINSKRSNHYLGYSYGQFSSLNSLSLGWSTTECFDNCTIQPLLNITQPGNLKLNFNEDNVIKSIKLTAWDGNTQAIFTPSSNSGAEIGLETKIKIESGNFNTYNSLIFLACYGVNTEGGTDFTEKGGQLCAMAEFGEISDGTHYLVSAGRNAYHQMQFACKNDSYGVVDFNYVDFLRDIDDPYFGDITLFP